MNLNTIYLGIKERWQRQNPLEIPATKQKEQPLLLELFNLEQLKSYAIALAKKHVVDTRPGRDQLLPRLAENEKVLFEAYDLLCAAIKAKRSISPAGEWLLDNFHLIEEQIRTARLHLPRGYSRELPRLVETGGSDSGASGIPRVYDIALSIIAHVDGGVEKENISTFVSAYQEVVPLKIGELWAIPIMLRLALIENLRRVAARVMIAMNDRSLAMFWTEQMLQTVETDHKNLILTVADMARTNPPMSNAFVAELVRNLQGHSPDLDLPLTWIEYQLASLGRSTQQTVKLEGQQQASNQVSVSSSVGSLRFLSAMDWREFVESMSYVDQQLRRDPTNIYASMDFATRDHYRHIVERLAKRSGRNEWDIAHEAVELAERHYKGGDILNRQGHIGYFLVDKGYQGFKKQIFAASKIPTGIAWNDVRIRYALFLGSISILTLLISAMILVYLSNATISNGIWILLIGATLVFSSQVALGFINRLTTAIKAPHLLPRLDFSRGIPAECRTLIAVPSMLVKADNVVSLIDALEVRYLANREQHLHFALLTDVIDAPKKDMPGDETLIRMAVEGINQLNDRYRDSAEPGIDIFYLFHRAREWNAQEQVWMGYERKRGKLEALNAFIGSPAKERDKSRFSVIAGNVSALPKVKYVITLDTDTGLPRETAHKLVSTMFHPLNRPEFDPTALQSGSHIVTEGYGILQPRVAINLPSATRSWFAKLYAGDPGIDPYTRAVSDVYQDLFHEGSFIGKGIYDVEAFSKALSQTLPENLILSHDLIEGSFARCGLVSDVLLYEEYPSSFSEDAARRSRWIRGDWQIAAWLLPMVPGGNGHWQKNQLSLISKWKIFDNLRRSLVPTATFTLFVLGWLSLENPWYLNNVILLFCFLPALFASLLEIFDKQADANLRSHLPVTLFAAGRRVVTAALSIVFLPFEVLNSLGSIFKSVTRMLITHKHLLAWRSASDPRISKGGGIWQFYQSMWAVPATVLLLASVLFSKDVTQDMHSLRAALPYLLFWFLSPAIASWLSRDIPEKEEKLTVAQANDLKRLARKTWRFFETFVDSTDHWLPPDNFQEYPDPVVAHRTSPTNIGLSLLANLSAYDFGYISATRLLDRTLKVFTTMEVLERYKGHFYNWYDTQSLKPLPPHYVSTVDSGNLSGCLLTLRPGLKGLIDEKIIHPRAFQGLKDTIDMLIYETPHASEAKKAFKNLILQLSTPPETLRGIHALIEMIKEALATYSKSIAGREEEHSTWWLTAIEKQCQDCLEESLKNLAPWYAVKSPTEQNWKNILFDMEAIPRLKDVALLASTQMPLIDDLLNDKSVSEPDREWLIVLRRLVGQAALHAADIIQAITNLSQQCEELASAEYDFLYDKSRHLLAIGYNASEHRRDGSFYDLLASEARLCSYVAISQGLLPQEHWFALGRLLTGWKGEPTLLSWSGSMFEYLMPLLVMPTFSNTLLDQTYKTSIKRQIEYGNQRGVPWGISESGYNATDAHMNYQYRAFGVPGLGFKRGLAEDLVIAPYATAMALMVVPSESCSNLKRMEKLGFEGRYGFYEAIDYTPARLGSEQTHVVIRSFMAHHQGMAFLSMAYHLLDRKMQKRFLSDPLFKATELLLHERVPKAARLYPHAPEVSEAARIIGEKEISLRVVTTPHTQRPEVHFLSNGRYTVMVTNSGGGYSRWKDLAVTRWREDPTQDNWGTFCYLRDVESEKIWSAAYQPTLKDSDHYEAIFPQAKAEFRRRDNDIEMHTEITVSPEDDIELRRFSITNLSNRTRIIELTSYGEVVLSLQSADEAHPVFNNLFVQTEIIAEKQAILCTRRPRSDKEATPTMVHLMSVHGTVMGEISYETDRSNFIGRGRNITSPSAMVIPNSHLGGKEGSVLDPIVSIRCRIKIEPEQTARVHIVTGIGETREAALNLVDTYHDRHIADRVFDLAHTHRQVALRQSNVTEADAQMYGRLAGSVLYANPLRRATFSVLSKNRRGQSGLWGQGISGDLPIILLRISKHDAVDIVRQVVQSHAYWRSMGLSVDLVIWNEDDSTYRQNLNDQILSLIAAGDAALLMDKPGGIFVRRVEQLSEEDRILLQTVARVIITDTGGSLAEQIERRRPSQPSVPLLTLTRERSEDSLNIASQLSSDLLFSTPLGGFTADGSEYQILTSLDKPTPAPWVNVIANQFFGTVISESGSAYTWCENAHEFRLTPWSNDPVSDPSGEAFYIRDDESGEYWSPTPLPVRASSSYLTSHGFGYSRFENTTSGIETELTTFVAIDAPIKIITLKLRNISGRNRRISATGYCEWAMGEHRSKSLMHISSEVDPTNAAILARNPYHAEFGGRIAFFDLSEKDRTLTCDRTEFLGRNGHASAPAAMLAATLSGRVGSALDSCAAMQTVIELIDNQETELVFVLGVGRDEDDARTLIKRFGSPSAAHLAFEEVKSFWKDTLSAVQIKTPDQSIDVLVNGWLTYQVIACRIWARSGFYQSGGAFGFRDQLQDAMALLHTKPRILREQILRCSARQFREGDVQHWWHPPSGRGVRTHFSDDYLWLPLATCRYVLGIGDIGVLSVKTFFIEGRQLKPDEEAYADLPRISDDSATVYEHCVLAIRRGLKFGAHGLPLMGCGDWNDGMNLVGEQGKGESVWLAFFLIEVLNQFSKVATLYGDSAFSQTCLEQAAALQKTVEKNGWDGEWYRRAYFDNGQPLGSADNLECQIDSLPQSWAVLSGAGDKKRSQKAMDAVYHRLVDRNHRLIKLFDPPFDKSVPNPGYIRGYVPGVRENGGQYTHAAIWSAMAFAEMGNKNTAWELLAMMNPLNHAKNSSELAVYKVEPYVIAADVYAVSPHAGRGGWTWYTGAAGWMYRLIFESLLGIHLEVETLHFAPMVPDSWSEFRITYRFRRTLFNINLIRAKNESEQGQVLLDGVIQAGLSLQLVDDLKTHDVEVRF